MNLACKIITVDDSQLIIILQQAVYHDDIRHFVLHRTCMCACVPESKKRINYSRPVTQISTNYTTYAFKYTNVYSINMNIQRILGSNKLEI